jgi:23S rRNA (guanosine2251-2'-O)-methyltransferase
MKNKQLIYGVHPVLEALKEGSDFEKIFIQKTDGGKSVQEVRRLAMQHNINVQFVPKAKLDRFTRKNHQGVIGFTALIPYQDMGEIVTQAFEKGETPALLVLDGVTDVRNLGALARSAYCFGFHAMILPEKGSALINDDALKTSAGALNHLPVCKVKSLSKAMTELKDFGLQIISCTEKAEDELKTAKNNEPFALILGSEEDGISSKILEISTMRVFIPMKRELGSLNVSVAGGIAMQELSGHIL